MSAKKAKSEEVIAPDLLTLALELIAENGWRGLSFSELAERAGMPMPQVREAFSGRADVLTQLSRSLDRAMLKVDADDMDGLPSRDRVFELMMNRFEAMAPVRKGMLRLMKDARCDPALLAHTACRLDRSMAWLQDAAGLTGRGRASPLCRLRRDVQRRMLGAVYVRTLTVWASDDSTDLAKTMAALDKQLRRIAGLAGLDGAKARPSAA